MSLGVVAGSAAVVCVCSLIVGEAIWRFTRVAAPAWASPVVGFATLIVVALAAVRLPGDDRAGAIGLAVVVLVALALSWKRARAELPRILTQLGAMALGLVAGLLPFIVNGRADLLGVTDNSDLVAHLMLADGIRAGRPAVGVDPAWIDTYPTGPHSLVAALAAALGTDVATVFMGLLAALAALSVATALAALHDLPPLRRQVGALVAGVPYLVAAYLVQASFKEPIVATFLLGWVVVLPLAVAEGRRHPGVALPLALIAGAAFASYSTASFAWLVMATAVWIALLVARDPRAGRAMLRSAKRPALVLGVLVVLVAAPEFARARGLLGAIVASASGESTGGNIRTQIPAYEVLGIWPSADLRAFGAGATLLRGLAALAAAACAYAAWRCWRRGRVELLAAAAGALVIYAATRARATPYYTAKALAIASLPVLVVAVAGLMDAWPPAKRRRTLGGALAASAVVAFVGLAGWSAALALRGARLAPRAHPAELGAIRGLVHGSPTLYLGQNDYFAWRLRGTPTAFPYAYVGTSQVPLETRPSKPFQIAQTYDFDSVVPRGLDAFRFVVAPRSAYTSEPPGNWRRVRQTRSYDVWERTGPTAPREILDERGAPGAVLDCSTPPGSQLATREGIAAVRPRPILIAVGTLRDDGGRRLPSGEFRFSALRTGGRARAKLPDMPPGLYELSAQIVSPVELEGRLGASRLSAPPSMAGPGGFWRLGEFRATGAPLTLTLRAHPTARLSAFRNVLVGTIAATPIAATRIVPLRKACGRYVDWYRLRGS